VKGSLLHKAEAAFDVAYSMKGNKVNAPKGKVSLRIYSYYDKNGAYTPGELHTYVVRSNAIASLAITAPTAKFTSKANISEEIVVDGVTTLVSIEGNCTLLVDLGDYSSTGLSNVLDKVGITVQRNAGGLWYSNNWVVNKTIETFIFGGDVVVSGLTTPQLSKTANPSSPDTTENEMPTNSAGIIVTAYPNPSDASFFLKNISDTDLMVSIYTASGQLVAKPIKVMAQSTYEFGSDYKSGMYVVEVLGTNYKDYLKLIKK